MQRQLVLVLVAPLLLAPSLARADVVSGAVDRAECAPIECPRGSMAFNGAHGGCPAGCGPWSEECRPDGTCTGGADCVATRLCIELGPRGSSIGPVAHGECAADGTCAIGTCSTASRCRPPEQVPEPRVSSGSCAVSTRRASGSLWLVSLLALLVIHRCRRAVSMCPA